MLLHAIYKTIVALAIIHVLLDNRQPAKTVAWVMVIYFLPVAGPLLYMFFGANVRKHRRTRRLDRTRQGSVGFSPRTSACPQERTIAKTDKWACACSRAKAHAPLPVDLYTAGSAFFPALLAAIARAKQSIHVCMYIFADDKLGRTVADALIAAAERGVRVRVIYDDVGSWRTPAAFFRRMRAAGVEVEAFLPVWFPQFTSRANCRNHRKLVVIDSATAFTGGMNIADRYALPTWRDTMVRVSGPAAEALQSVFAADWKAVSGADASYGADAGGLASPEGDTEVSVVAAGPFAAEPDLSHAYVRMIMTARRYVYIETPYFMPPEPVMFALKNAALAGVDVRVLVPERADARFVGLAGRSYMREAAAAGVHILYYRRGFLHSKLAVADDRIAACGSANCDFRSFENNFEATVFFDSPSIASRFRSVFEADAADAAPMPADASRPFVLRLTESVARLLSPLM